MDIQLNKIEQTSYAACKARARQLVVARLRIYKETYKKAFVRVCIKDMRSRWGSCSSKGNLNFNYRVLFLPIELVDYIIVHELCHLEEMNHSKKFWQLVRQTIPNYRHLVLILRRLERQIFMKKSEF